MMEPLAVRLAAVADAPAIAAIYNEGIDSRVATFETAHRTVAQIEAWFEAPHPVIVVTAGNRVVGFAAASAYRPRACYAGIAEFSVYVDVSSRGRGAGRLAMEALAREAADRGYWKLLSRVFLENQASRRLLASCGFREVGVYRNHGRLDGVWRDVVIVERLIGEGAGT